MSPPSHKHIGDSFVAVTAVTKSRLIFSCVVVNFCRIFVAIYMPAFFSHGGGMSRFVSFGQRNFDLHIFVDTEHAVGVLFTTQSRYFRY